MQTSPASAPVPITKPDTEARYADCTYHKLSNRIICIKEDHNAVKSGAKKEAENTIVMIDIETQAETVLVTMILDILETNSIKVKSPSDQNKAAGDPCDESKGCHNL